ncbi:MAG: hypothetical protein ACI90V_005136, partial [Bacillariaceae sp.]
RMDDKERFFPQESKFMTLSTCDEIENTKILNPTTARSLFLLMRVSGGGEGRRVFLIKKANRLEKMQINNIFTVRTSEISEI